MKTLLIRKALLIRLAEIGTLLYIYLYITNNFSYVSSPLLRYSIRFLIIVFVTDIGAALLSQKSLSSSYLSKPKTRFFYISCGLLLAIFVAYYVELWEITGLLGEDTYSLFWDCFLPANLVIAVSMLLVMGLIYFNNPNKKLSHFTPMAIGMIVSVFWWFIIYQKCMDKSILLTSSGTLDMLTYAFYLLTAIAIVLVTVVATIYKSLKNLPKQTNKT